jgi:FMN phosphatase YigB (HAD superfamily)
MPTLWFDVDDVLVETSPLTEASLRALTGKNIPIASWPHHHFVEIYELDAEGKAAMLRSWMDEGLLECAKLRPGVREAMDRLAGAGFELALITARSWHPQGEELTWKMARDHQLPVSQIVVMDFEDSKAEVLKARGARVDGFVDDTVRHVRGCLEQGWRAFVMNHPWNSAHDLPFRVDSLGEFADHFDTPSARSKKGMLR